MNSLGECLSYINGVVVLDVSLPTKAPYCQYCKLAKYEESFRRYSCRATGEWLLNPLSSRGAECSIQFKEE